MTAQHQTPLRFITAGSVDDGKSTLIGRLLYDSKALLSDQIKTLESGKSKGLKEAIDFSILTDGLEAEREQGITIDVAYRYFSTAKRKFIIADTPGHEQYTRNMVTGASTASAAVVLVDASQLDFGAQPLQLLPQTKRHSAILRQLNCPHIVVAVNKMDLLDYSEDKFNAIVEAYRRLAEQLGLKDAHFVPMSALLGDNIVYPGGNMPWYKGEPLLSILETLPGADEVSRTADDFYFPVQLVVRQDADKADDFRGYQGRIERGSVAVGQTVRIEPNGLTAEVSEIITPKGEVAQAFAGEAATLRLDRDIDVSRGDLFVDKNSPLAPQKHLEATLCWFDERPLNTARKYLLKHGTQTGNAKSVADKAADSLEAAGIQVSRAELKDYKAKNIAGERRLLLVTSTQGEGEPPEEAVVLHKLLNGKKAPKLDKLQFAVLGLGDSSYPNFCQAGKDFDRRFEELGAKRLLERVDADLDFTASANAWTDNIAALLKEEAAKNRATPAPQTTPPAGLQTAPDGRYCKAAPFPAALLANQKITARQSDKDVRHIEIDLSGSDLHYLPGDALGVWFDNDPALVREILDLLGIDPATEIQAGGKMMPVARALSSHFELTQNTPAFVKGYAAFAHYEELDKIIADNAVLQDFVQNTPIVDVLHRFPASLTAEQFIRLLRPLAPRLYSISSAQAEVGDEVHLTVGVVRFEHEGRARTGGASGFLADRLEEDGTVRVFVERNDGFRLPEDSRKPIVMIGSGTGVAPFRAFVQQRAAENAEGKNWLIFGNPHFARDFLYQTEWQQFAKDGFLHRYDFAWSRDQEEKIYVQDKIREQAEGLWQWLQEGAHIYVCGDAAKMAKDVEAALLDVIIGAGHLDEEGAEEYLDMLREEKRYQRDVY